MSSAPVTPSKTPHEYHLHLKKTTTSTPTAKYSFMEQLQMSSVRETTTLYSPKSNTTLKFIGGDTQGTMEYKSMRQHVKEQTEQLAVMKEELKGLKASVHVLQKDAEAAKEFRDTAENHIKSLLSASVALQSELDKVKEFKDNQMQVDSY